MKTNGEFTVPAELFRRSLQSWATLSYQLLEAWYGKRKYSILKLKFSCEFTSTSDTLRKVLELMKVNCPLYLSYSDLTGELMFTTT